MTNPSHAFPRQVKVVFFSGLLLFFIYGMMEGIVLYGFSEFFPPFKFLPHLLHYFLYGLIAGAAGTAVIFFLKLLKLSGKFTDFSLFRFLMPGYILLAVFLHGLIGICKNFNRVELGIRLLIKLQNPVFYFFLVLTILFGLSLFLFIKTRKAWPDLWIFMISLYSWISFFLSLSLLNDHLYQIFVNFQWTLFLKTVFYYMVILIFGSFLFYLLISRLHAFRHPSKIVTGGLKVGVPVLILTLAAFGLFYMAGRDRSGRTGALDHAKDRPNIVFIVIDTLRADHLSCYGYPLRTSATMDQMAKEGSLFQKAVAPGGWTLPTHASMFSGLFVSRHGANSEGFQLDQGIMTLAEYLSRAGYYSAGFCNNAWVSMANGFDQGFQSYFEMWKTFSYRYSAKDLLCDIIQKHHHRKNFKKLVLKDRDAAVTNRVLLEWIEKNYRKKQPLFLFINYMDVHAPYEPPQTISYPFLPEPLLNHDYRLHPAYFHFNYETYDAQTIKNINLLYDGGIYYVDHQLGRLFDRLFSRLPLDDTLVIITSDHGENLSEHQMLGHEMTLYNTVINVPLIIRYPKHFKKGAVITTPVQTVDLFPTIVDLLDPENEDVLSGMQGRSLLRSGALDERPFLISEYFNPEPWLKIWKKGAPDVDPGRIMAYNRRIRSIERGDYKYIWYSDGTAKLYNLREDPLEEQNIIEAFPGIASEMKTRLQEWLNSFPHREKSPAERKEIDQTTRQSLKALGYLS